MVRNCANFANEKDNWDKSYANGDNFVFYPHEEVIRFVSKYIRKRIGFNEFIDVKQSSLSSSFSDGELSTKKILDLGCGIGRHVKFCWEMGLDPYGVDLSEIAVTEARKWLSSTQFPNPEFRIVQSDARNLPWKNNTFSYAVSHGVLDSMPFEISRAACIELARIMEPGGLFYCDLISGDDSFHSREFSGEEIVNTLHEKDTTQLYFNMSLIHELIEGSFSIKSCKLLRSEDVFLGTYTSRYHIVLQCL